MSAVVLPGLSISIVFSGFDVRCLSPFVHGVSVVSGKRRSGLFEAGARCCQSTHIDGEFLLRMAYVRRYAGNAHQAMPGSAMAAKPARRKQRPGHRWPESARDRDLVAYSGMTPR
jgi:hypothetical protein